MEFYSCREEEDVNGSDILPLLIHGFFIPFLYTMTTFFPVASDNFLTDS